MPKGGGASLKLFDPDHFEIFGTHYDHIFCQSILLAPIRLVKKSIGIQFDSNESKKKDSPVIPELNPQLL